MVRPVPLHIGALLGEALAVILVVSEGSAQVPLPLQEMQTFAVLEEWRAMYREKTWIHVVYEVCQQLPQQGSSPVSPGWTRPMHTLPVRYVQVVEEAMAAETVQARDLYTMQAPVRPLYALRLLFAMAQLRKVVEYNLLGQIQILSPSQLMSSQGR